VVPTRYRSAVEAILRSYFPHPSTVEIEFRGAPSPQAILSLPPGVFGSITEWYAPQDRPSDPPRDAAVAVLPHAEAEVMDLIQKRR